MTSLEFDGETFCLIEQHHVDIEFSVRRAHYTNFGEFSNKSHRKRKSEITVRKHNCKIFAGIFSTKFIVSNELRVFSLHAL